MLREILNFILNWPINYVTNAKQIWIIVQIVWKNNYNNSWREFTPIVHFAISTGLRRKKKVEEKVLSWRENSFPREFFLLQFCPRWKFISFSLDILSEVGNTNEERWLYKTRRVMLLPLDNEQSPEVTTTWRGCLEFKKVILPNDESLI